MASLPTKLRVIKIGGSLLDVDDLTQRIPRWISRQPTVATIWIVGGGKLVESIRQRDKRSESAAEDVHWKCIGEMDNNSRLVASWFPNWKPIDSLENVDFDDPAINLILSPLKWTRTHAPHLPMTWDVTSDSIAASLANWVGASELVLLKSLDPPRATGIQAAIAQGFVDRFFLQAVSQLDARERNGSGYSIRVVNLRSSSFRELVWEC